MFLVALRVRHYEAQLPPRRVLLNSFPSLSVGLVEFVLNLLHTISTRYQHTSNDQWVGLLLAGLKLLSGLVAQPLVPRHTVIVAPVEGLAGAENLAVQRQSLASGRAGFEVFGCGLGGARCYDGGGHVGRETRTCWLALGGSGVFVAIDRHFGELTKWHSFHVSSYRRN